MSYTDKEKTELINELINDKVFEYLIKYKNTKKEEENLLTLVSLFNEVETTHDVENFGKHVAINNKKQYPVSTRVTIEANGEYIEISNSVDTITINNIKKLINRQIDIKHEICEHYLKLFTEEM